MRLRSSMAEQLPLKQLVEGSNPPGVTKRSDTFTGIRPFGFNQRSECLGMDQLPVKGEARGLSAK